MIEINIYLIMILHTNLDLTTEVDVSCWLEVDVSCFEKYSEKG